MGPNGENITEQELDGLPEKNNVVLWQTEEGPSMVTDSKGYSWRIGFYQGTLYKSRMR